LVLGLVHDAHSAATQLAYNTVVGDGLLEHVPAMLGRGQKQVNFSACKRL
jgi:hypothetical protein